MAYVLGFILSDGNVYTKTLSLKLSNKHKTDKLLLIKINKVMDSNYPIKTGPTFFRLRISNPIIIHDLRKLGVIQNKSKVIKFPKVPNMYLRHFIRGYLDGDGWITVRNRKKFKEIIIGFCTGSHNFMRMLIKKLQPELQISKYNLRTRTKITKKGKVSCCYSLEFYSTNAINLIKYLYNDLRSNDLYLQRKFVKQLEARAVYEEYFGKTRLWRTIEKKFGNSMDALLAILLDNEKLDGVQIAKSLNVHPSTVYRWLAKTNVRQPVEKGSQEWITRVHWKNLQNK